MDHRLGKCVGMLSLAICVLIVLPGCSEAQRFAPHMGFGGFDMEAELDRDDIVVLDRVEGTSSTTTVLGIPGTAIAIVQVIDGDKYRVFGIPFFKDKYVWKTPGELLPGTSTASRAYYKALEAHPEGDAIFCKSQEREVGGVPGIYHTETVTWKGKAIKLVSDR